jgi:thymidylate synthase
VEQYLEKLITSIKSPNETYTYGEDLEPQIQEVIRMYKEDGHHTNQAYMAVGSAESLSLGDPPCLRGIDTRIRYGKLHFMLYFRSWDLWAGFPSNLAGLQLLKSIWQGRSAWRMGRSLPPAKDSIFMIIAGSLQKQEQAERCDWLDIGIKFVPL